MPRLSPPASPLRACLLLLLLVLTAVGCGEVAATNPFDPATPSDQQARSTVRGRLVPSEGYDLAQAVELRVDLQPASGDGELAAVEPARDGDAKGRFVFEGVAPGTYLLTTAVQGFTPMTLPLQIEAGTTLELGDLALRPTERPEQRGRLTGVAQRQGAAADGHEGISVRVDGTPYSTLTAASGQFSLELPAGLYGLTLSAPGYGVEALADVRVAGAGAETALPDPVVLSAQPGAIHGTLFAADLTDPEAVLPTAQLTLTRDGDAAPTQVVSPEATGRFVLPDVGAGRYRLTATLDGFAPADEDVEVAPGQSVSLGRVVLLAAPPGQLTGHAFLSAAPELGHGGIRVAVDGRPFATETLADGGFSLSLPAGRYALTFTAAGYAPYHVPEVRVAAGSATELSPEPVLLARAGAVRGVLALTGAAAPDALLPDAILTLTAAGGADAPIVSHPDATGAFGFEVPRPGTWSLRVTLDTFAPASLVLDVGPGQTIELGQLLLLPAPEGLIEGRARLALAAEDGHAGSRVALIGRGTVVETLPDGAFTLSAPAGTYDLSVSHPGYAAVEVLQVQVQPGEVTSLPEDLVLAAQPGRIQGLVELPAGYADAARLARVVVGLYRAGAAGAPEQVTAPAADGTVVLDGVAPGTWRVEAALDEAGLEGATAVVEVRPGERAELPVLRIRTAALQPGERPTEVAGTVRLAGMLDPFGHAGTVVSVLTTPLATVTGADGHFRLTGVPSGVPLTLNFHHAGFGSVSLELPALAREQSYALPAEVILPALPGALRGAVALDRFGTEAVLARVSLTLTGSDGAVVATPGHDAEGVFVADALPAGAYRLVVQLAGYHTESLAVTLRPGEVTEVGTVLLRHKSGTAEGVPLAGTVTLSGRADHGGTSVRVEIFGSGAHLGTVTTDASGAFELPAAPDERYLLSLEHPGFLPTAGLGPCRYDAARGLFVDAADEPLVRHLSATPFVGSIQVRYDLAPAWVPAWQVQAAVELVSAEATQVVDGVAPGQTIDIDVTAAGPYFVRVRRAGFVPLESLVELNEAAPSAAVEGPLRLESLGDAALDLGDATLRDTDLEGIDLRDAPLAGVTLLGDFTGRPMQGARLAGADLQGATLIGALLSRADLSGVDLTGVDLTGADLTGARLFGARLDRATLVGARLDTADLSNATLRGALFVGPDETPPAVPCGVDDERPGVSLVGTVLAGATLEGAALPGVDLRGADLTDAQLVGTNLQRTCMRGAVLTLTNLTRADLSQADLRRASVVLSVLDGTLLRGADLTQARLTSSVLENARLGCFAQRADGTCACAEAMESTAPGGACADPDTADADQCRCRTRLAGANLNGANLAGADFSGADLLGASVMQVLTGDVPGVPDSRPTDCHLPAGCEWPGSVAPACAVDAGRACNVRRTRFVGARLDTAELPGVLFAHADLTAASLRGTNLTLATFTPSCTFPGAVFSGADLTGAQFDGTDLRGVDLGATRAHRTSLRGADLAGASLEGADLDFTDLTDARIAAADLRNTRLRGVDLNVAADVVGRSLDLSGVDLEGEDLRWLSRRSLGGLDPMARPAFIRLDGAHLADARFDCGRVDCADLAFRSLRGADLRRVDLSHVDPSYADLTGADLRGARWPGHRTVKSVVLDGAQLTGMTSDDGAFLFDRSSLQGVDLTGTPMTSLEFERVDLRNATIGLTVTGEGRDLTLALSRVDGLRIEPGAVAALFARTQDLRGLNWARILAEPALVPIMNLRLCDLRNVDFRGRPLNSASNAPTMLTDCDLRGARFDGATFAPTDGRTVLTRLWTDTAQFAGVRMNGVDFQFMDLHGIDFSRADLRDLELQNTPTAGLPPAAIVIAEHRHEAVGADLRLVVPQAWSSWNVARADLRGATFTERIITTNLTGARLAGTDLTDRSRLRYRLSEVNFAGADLSGATLPVDADRVLAELVSFREARLSGLLTPVHPVLGSRLEPFLERVDLAGADLSGIVTKMTIHHSDLSTVARAIATSHVLGNGNTLAGADLTALRAAARSLAYDDTTLDDADFSGSALLPFHFVDSTLLRAHFVEATLPFAGFERSVLSGADFTGADLGVASFAPSLARCVDLDGASLRDAALSGLYTDGCLSAVGADFEGAVFRGPVYRFEPQYWPRDGSLIDASEGWADLRGADFTNARLGGADLADFDLRGVNFTGADLDDTLLAGASLTDARLGGAHIERADLSGAVLTRADLSAADLDTSDLSGCVANGANLRGASLQSVVLREASLVGADLRGADLRRADLVEAVLSGAALDGARLCESQRAHLPAGGAGVPLYDRGC